MPITKHTTDCPPGYVREVARWDGSHGLIIEYLADGSESYTHLRRRCDVMAWIADGREWRDGRGHAA